jgi:hypothetical protein
MQSGRARHVFDAGRQIYAANRLKGLYKGYGIALIEDVVEMDIRNRVYDKFKKGQDDPYAATYNIFIGMIACSFAAAFTTPCDNVRLHMCMNQFGMGVGVGTGGCVGPVGAIGAIGAVGPVQTAQRLVLQHGPSVLYRGVYIRTLSNALKSASFFVIFELLQRFQKQKVIRGA